MSTYEEVQKGGPKKISGCVIAAVVGVGVLAVAALVLGVWYVGQYNRAVALQEGVKEKWAQVDVTIERRFDLVPNLVNTVKGFAKQEKEIFENLASARKEYMGAKSVAGKAGAASLFEKSLANVLALAENYPQLRSNENFLRLQDELSGTENRIAVARTRYNAAVRGLNTYHRSFFGGYFCRRAGVEPGKFYEVPEKKKAVPEVKF